MVDAKQCVECGRILSNYRAMRCRNCASKIYGFKKGQKAWNKGHHLSEITKKKISKKLRIIKRGHPRTNFNEPHNKGKNLIEIHGIKKAEKIRARLSNSHKGQIPASYIDGRSKTKSPARYGDDWDAVRYLVYLRDKFTCQDCGIKGIRLDVHHKIPYLISGDNSIENLTTLCRKCHMKAEHKIRTEIICEVESR